MTPEPHAPLEVRQMSVSELRALQESGLPFELVDVRTPAERALAQIEGSRLLDQEFYDSLVNRDRDTMLVFQCHHGMRSQSAAQHFLELGFTNLHNVVGGIEAWSREIDPSIPRY